MLPAFLQLAVDRVVCPLFLIVACLATALSLWAHDIPNDVTVQTFLKPSGQRMELLMRVPLIAMRDVVFPEKTSAGNSTGYLDLEKTDPLLSGAATLWLSDFIDVYEGDAKLPKPQVIATRISLESDKSFADFEAARAHVLGPQLPPETNVAWNQTYLDVLFEYPIHSDQSLYSIHARLEETWDCASSPPSVSFNPVGPSAHSNSKATPGS